MKYFVDAKINNGTINFQIKEGTTEGMSLPSVVMDYISYSGLIQLRDAINEVETAMEKMKKTAVSY